MEAGHGSRAQNEVPNSLVVGGGIDHGAFLEELKQSVDLVACDASCLPFEDRYYSSAVEWANKARDVPRELPRGEAGPALCRILWRSLLALLGIVVSFISLRSLRRR